jgi:GNAT superfamily N-acetyltransferase
MCDEWMAFHKLPLTLEQFHRLPRHPAYKYEYLDGVAWLSPRPKFYHACLDLASFAPSMETPVSGEIRRLRDADWNELVTPFAAAFRNLEPFGGLEDAERREAAAKSLAHARTGGDGPLIRPACFVASGGDQEGVLGAILITLLPLADLESWDGYHWQEPPPPDCVERRLGRPHLTWVFVKPFHAGRGLGTALLSAAIEELRRLGFRELASTFLLGNHWSMLWHWRNGFRLLAYPGSARRGREFTF